MSVSYGQFLRSKVVSDPATGLRDLPDLSPMLFDFQRDIVRWALRRGRAAIFADCGLGKTPMQLEWARHIPGRVLILAPLAVSAQTVREAGKFGIDGVEYSRGGSAARIVVTNYEMLPHFDPADFTGIVLDESSILKSYDGATRNAIIEAFAQTPFRLACTATPAPNDYMELGNHAEFLGALTRSEMLSTYFVHDGGETQKWRLKGHAERDFWRWLCSWAVTIRKPSDLGYEDGDFILPPIEYIEHVVHAEKSARWLSVRVTSRLAAGAYLSPARHLARTSNGSRRHSRQGRRGLGRLVQSQCRVRSAVESDHRRGGDSRLGLDRRQGNAVARLR